MSADAPTTSRFTSGLQLVMVSLALAGVVFAAGGGYYSHLDARAQIAKLDERVRRHEALPHHPAVALLEHRVGRAELAIESGQQNARALDVLVRTMIRKQDAMCLALPRCKPGDDP
jgi:hypothetical protein